ncbi:MAG TPA: response regulator transcription factor [Thermoanaerobaculia bacterium]
MKSRILIVEDDRKTVESLAIYLQAAGYDVHAVHDGVSGLEEARSGRYDLVLLDLMLPGLYGMDVCRRLRSESNVAVVMLTARTREDDQVRGLELGADDYITKPFSPRQVVARIATILRRQQRVEEDRLRFDALELDVRSLRATLGDRGIDVTPTEARILRTLMTARGRAVSRDQIAVSARLGDGDVPDLRAIDVHVKNLRRKLNGGPVAIATTFGVGYRLALRDEETA